MTFMALAIMTATADPLAPARAGKVQCYQPDIARKKCRSISVIQSTGPDKYKEDETVLVASNPMIIFHNATSVQIKDGAACGQLKAEDLDAGTFTLNGSPMEASTATSLHARVKAGLGPLLGKTICQRYEQRGLVLVQHSTVDGEARPELDESVIWVFPAESYSVTP